MSYKILAINPGSTSTKIALYENEKEVDKKNIEHPTEEISKYKSITDQYEMRYKAIIDFMKERNFDINELSAVVGRGGILPPVKSGAYQVNPSMVDRLKNRPIVEHASNLGALIAYEIAQQVGVNAYIYDSIAVDEFEDIARITGLAEVKRKSLVHTLNMRAAAMKTAAKLEKKYSDLNLIVAHLGGGITLSVHNKGKMVDIVSDDEGPFSPERSGRISAKELVKLAAKYDQGTMTKMLRGNAGLVSHLGTNSAIEVEERINNGDSQAKLVYEALAYQIAKGIGELATVVSGEVDRIVITGGIAYSKMLTEWISNRVKFIAPVEIVPGENELESLALGTLRVLKGEEKANVYDLD